MMPILVRGDDVEVIIDQYRFFNFKLQVGLFSSEDFKMVPFDVVTSRDDMYGKKDLTLQARSNRR